MFIKINDFFVFQPNNILLFRVIAPIYKYE